MTDANQYPFQNPGLTLNERADDLLSRLTVEEKCAQMTHDAPAVPRLGLPAYVWWNECLHGVARAGLATVFPQAIGLAATFDTVRMDRVATAVSDEARAKHHTNAERGDRGIYKGLTFWTPNINIFRDPRWGRGHETYGECPYLTARMGATFVKGLQGDDPNYLKLVATPKHFAAHSGPEAHRHEFDTRVSKRDLWETYLPAFRACVVESGAFSVMGAYNRLDGEPCCAHTMLMGEILRGDWGFEGYYVSDCGALNDFHEHHGVTRNAAESAALALKRGCDLNCGCVYTHLMTALRQELITEKDIDTCLRRLIRARLRLGMFDPPESVPYSRISYEVVDSPDHRQLALDAARASIILLKNSGDILPFKGVGTIGVIGPNADEPWVLWGNYNGTPSSTVTPLQGIRAAAPDGTRVLYAPGCEHIGTHVAHLGNEQRGFAEACYVAEQSDVVVMCMGLTPKIEGEEGDANNSDAAGDRSRIELPDVQQELLKAIHVMGKPVVLVVISGSAVALPFETDHLPAIVQQFYPGQSGGRALAEVLFGQVNPAGRLPVTFYRSTAQLPAFDDYSMRGRTYRYLTDEPTFPFGFGLSYTRFRYSGLALGPGRIQTGETARLEVDLTNEGARSGEEVAQVYLTREDAGDRAPLRQLVGFSRVPLEPGQTKRLSFALGPRELALVNDEGEHVVEAGRLTLWVGGSQPDGLSQHLGAPDCVQATLEISGSPVKLAR